MPGTQHKRVNFPPPPRWLGMVSGRLKAIVTGHVDADIESAAAIYRRFNVIRFCSLRGFRRYVRGRRRAIRKYEARQRRQTGRPTWQPPPVASSKK